MLVAIPDNLAKVKVCPYYFRKGHPGTSSTCYIREQVLEMLMLAGQALPKGIHLVVIDGWRSYETQLFLYEQQLHQLQKNGFSGMELEREMKKYVAKPTMDIHNPSPHLTGGAVDVTLSNEKEWLPMGTAFDEFSNQSRLNWYETDLSLSKEETLWRGNRRMLKEVMQAVGFTTNPEEWWHYEYGTKGWARSKGISILFPGVLKI